jgi:putative colanic acid biosynthesis UDP-glucose lipid carrier transferase
MGVALVLSEVYIPKTISRILFKNNRRIRAVVVGGRLGDKKFDEWISRQSLFGIQVVEKIPTSAISVDGAFCGSCVDIDEIRKCLERVRAHQIIISDLLLSQEVVRRLNDICDKIGVRIIYKFSADGVFGLLKSLSGDNGLIFAFPQGEPLENPLNRIIKRLFDIIISIPVVLLIIPLTSVLVWILQRYDSPGPVLYRQRRCGINNIPFEILKYRTMHTGVYDASLQARINDIRVSRYGKWLRKTSVDEFPQFINVLMGEMSVVGPRPHMEFHNLEWAELLNNYQKRSYVKPGITGLAQVRGFRGEARCSDDIRLRIDSDIEYIENWSLWLDLKITAKTIMVVFFPPKTAV